MERQINVTHYNDEKGNAVKKIDIAGYGSFTLTTIVPEVHNREVNDENLVYSGILTFSNEHIRNYVMNESYPESLDLKVSDNWKRVEKCSDVKQGEYIRVAHDPEKMPWQDLYVLSVDSIGIYFTDGSSVDETRLMFTLLWHKKTPDEGG